MRGDLQWFLVCCACIVVIAVGLHYMGVIG